MPPKSRPANLGHVTSSSQLPIASSVDLRQDVAGFDPPDADAVYAQYLETCDLVPLSAHIGSREATHHATIVRAATSLVAGLLAVSVVASAQPWQTGTDGLLPIAPVARVTDLTQTLASAEIASLEAKLATWEARTSNQLVVLMVPTTQPEPIESYALRVAEKWKIGRKGQDNGALFIIAKNDRKMRIEVGYGLEGVLPDVTARRIIAENVAPAFREGKFAEGIKVGVDRIITVVGEGRPVGQPQSETAIPDEKLIEVVGRYLGSAMLIDYYRERGGCADYSHEMPSSQSVLHEIKSTFPGRLQGKLDATVPGMTAEARRLGAEAFDALRSKGIDGRAVCGSLVGGTWPLFQQARDDWLRLAPRSRSTKQSLVAALPGALAPGPLGDEAAYKRGDYATALSIWRPRAEQGNAHAQYNLGLMYKQGEECRRITSRP